MLFLYGNKGKTGYAGIFWTVMAKGRGKRVGKA